MYRAIITFIILGFAGFLVFTGISTPVIWAGVALFAGLVVLARRPPVLIGMVFALTFWLPTASIYVFAPRMYLLGLAGILLLYDYIIHPQVDRKEIIIFIWLLLMIATVLIVNFHTNPIEERGIGSIIASMLKHYISGPILALFIYRKFKKTQDLVLMLKIVSWSFAIPAFIAILQYLEVGWAWQLPVLVSKLSTKPFVEPINLIHYRASGLHRFVIAFVYQAAIGVSISAIVAIYLAKTQVSKLSHGLLAILATFGGLANLTRSLLLGVLVMYGYLMWHIFREKTSGSRFFQHIVMAGISITILASGVYTLSNTEEEGSRLTDFHDVSRPQLWKAGIILAMEHPFGVGGGQTTEVISEERMNFVGRVNLGLVTKRTSHNYLLNQLIYFGIPGLVIILFMVIWPFVLVRGPALAGFEWMKYATWSILLLLYINSFFHNAGLTDIVLSWSAIGIAMLYNDQVHPATKDNAHVTQPPASGRHLRPGES